MARNYKQGKFKPRNLHKYLGDPTRIEFRSSWELKFLKILDLSDNVKAYASEEIVIPYISPVDGKPHRYFVDFLVITKTNKKILIEIKPHGQTLEPKKTRRKKESVYLNEVKTYMVNQAKWDAAKEFCRKRNMEFVVLTEKHVNFTF